MAIALLVTIQTNVCNPDYSTGQVANQICITSQLLTLVSERSAENALATIQKAYEGQDTLVVGSIIKDVII